MKEKLNFWEKEFINTFRILDLIENCFEQKEPVNWYYKWAFAEREANSEWLDLSDPNTIENLKFEYWDVCHCANHQIKTTLVLNELSDRYTPRQPGVYKEIGLENISWDEFRKQNTKKIDGVIFYETREGMVSPSDIARVKEEDFISWGSTEREIVEYGNDLIEADKHGDFSKLATDNADFTWHIIND